MASHNDRRGHPHPRRGRPLPAGERFFTPGATGSRRRVEERSAAPITFLFVQVPRWVVPVVMVGLLLAGFAVPAWWGGVAVLPVIAFVGWLAYLSWPSLRTGGKVLRVAMLTFLTLLVASHFGVF